MNAGGLPPKIGLYDPRREHDACGVGFIADISGRKSHSIVTRGLEILNNLSHRGAVGADPMAGDGAGMLVQLPDSFFQSATSFALPAAGDYAVGMIFMPRTRTALAEVTSVVEHCIRNHGMRVLGWRTVPVNSQNLGQSVLPTEPLIRQIFIARHPEEDDQDVFERKLFVIRKQIENEIANEIEGQIRAADMDGDEDGDMNCKGDFYIASMSSRVVVYKGMLLAAQLGEYYPDLLSAQMESALALVHQRFSTNTFPAWSMAHPYRMIAHNGEINTLRGNINWMAARRGAMTSKLLGADLDKVWPVIAEGQSDSAAFDNALELLVAGGYSLAHAMMMLIPEAWSENALMDAKRRAFYEYHAAVMEPWDGPAAVAFTDGRQIGATLDRNGLRPARYLVTADGVVVMASEAGVLAIPPADIVVKWRLQPGKMLLIDLEQGRIIDDEEIKNDLACAHDYQRRLNDTQISLAQIKLATPKPTPTKPASIKHDAPDVAAMPLPPATLLKSQQAFGYTQEHLKFLLLPMILTATEAIGSMGNDVPPSVLSMHSQPLASYFQQNFAQVTNPPIDPIREQLVMSLRSWIGPKPNLLGSQDGDGSHDMRLIVRQPILTNEQLQRIQQIDACRGGALRSRTLSMCFAAADGKDGMADAIKRLGAQAINAVHDGDNILILSDRQIDAEHVAIPALLATSAVHHHLIRHGLRTNTGLVVETGACLEVHHAATLAGYGAEAINPYLAFDTIHAQLARLSGGDALEFDKAQSNYIAALGAGLKKVMSKMGISTYQSYCGAQIFDAVGLSTEFVDEYFSGTATAVEGVGLAQIAAEAFHWHACAHGDNPLYQSQLAAGGDYAYRVRGEAHVWNPETVSKLQKATRTNDAATFEEFSAAIDDARQPPYNLRGLFEFNWSDARLPIEQVEPASDIVTRFSTGAMSFGSISHEAHSNLARAMNRLGGKSNTGEGGEEAARYQPLADGSPNPERSAIKQIASGRFGVTTEYLVNADDLQIKMAQGAKPGEGGQIPGHKVNEQIAKVRHSIAGVGLISPPPHHDIYSIEDLAQLIHDLKNVNPRARISVKLVSELGVGTIAAGVSKAHADHVTISGHEGGTGASPLTSIKHAGSPWEIGLAETHQTLVLNKLRGRIAVQVDGGIRTGRDVAIGALLGADEFGFATAPLIVSGCLMMRKCHLNTCPVGVATQDPQLRRKFTGQPEHVINYFFFVAEQVRKIMARLGYRSMNEMIGQMQRLDMRTALNHFKTTGLDYSRILTKPKADADVAVYHREKQTHGIDKALDHELIKRAAPALQHGISVRMDIQVRNTNRTFGAMLSGRVAERYGNKGLPDDTIYIRAHGTAGQSFGAWLARGITIQLEGEANDYVGKGLSGGRLIIYPPRDAGFVKVDSADGKAAGGDSAGVDLGGGHIIIGNTVLYGATDGEFFAAGVAGERFCVRNSGAVAVVEGVGDHACEYMTGGVVVCLGPCGRNFAAGMSGGIAYMFDAAGDFAARCNHQSVIVENITADEHDNEHDLADMTRADETRLKKLIQRHRDCTNSRIATDILNHWTHNLSKFVKIMPLEYQRALQRMRTTADAPPPEMREETIHG